MADPLISGGLPSFANLGIAIQQAQWATLAALLKPGALLTAQVGESLGNNTWQVQIAGRSVVAESPTPLVSGTTIHVEVQSSGPQPQLRLLTNTTLTTLTTSDPAIQLAHLGLPNEPATRAVLAAFIRTGAPLVPARLAEAAVSLQRAPQHPELAIAHALVARSGLPAMPLTLELALRAAQPSTPLPIIDDLPSALSRNVAPITLAPIAVVSPSTMPLSPASALPMPAIIEPVTAQSLAIDLHAAGLRQTETVTASNPDRPATITADDPASLPLARIAQALMLHGDGPHTAELRTALVQSGAHTVFPPPELADYDLVLPMPLREKGQPIPARLAVTTRRSGNSPAATWLRVDTKLSRLGEVSIRLAAVEHGPLTIHVVASPDAHAAITTVFSDLEAALAAKGLTASLRLSANDD